MKAISRFLSLLLLIIVALSGCTTIEDPRSNGPPAQVTVYREPSSRDSFFPMRLSVDGRPATVLYPDEERSLEIKAGEHRLTYELGVYNCAAEVRLESGKTYAYRLARGCIIEGGDENGYRRRSAKESLESNWQEQHRTRSDENGARAVSTERSEPNFEQESRPVSVPATNTP